jgi:hypothetical protein
MYERFLQRTGLICQRGRPSTLTERLARRLGLPTHAEVREVPREILEQRVRLVEGRRPPARTGAGAGIGALVGQRRDALGQAGEDLPGALDGEVLAHQRLGPERRASGQRVHPFFCASTLTVLSPTPAAAAMRAWVSGIPS